MNTSGVGWWRPKALGFHLQTLPPTKTILYTEKQNTFYKHIFDISVVNYWSVLKAFTWRYVDALNNSF